MRTKIKVNGVYWKPMPWLEDGDCIGCQLDHTEFDKSHCINEEQQGRPCDLGGEFEGYIFVRATQNGIAEYVKKRLEKAG
jgi:hypothetical protein